MNKLDSYTERLRSVGISGPTKSEIDTIRRQMENKFRESKEVRNRSNRSSQNDVEMSPSHKDEVSRMSRDLRVSQDFSFDPTCLNPIFQGLNIFIDIGDDDLDYIDEVRKLCTKVGGTINKHLRASNDWKEEKTNIIIWHRGGYKTLQKAEEGGITVVNQNWVFDSIKIKKKLDVQKYQLTAYQREEAKTRQELGIKTLKPKVKRQSINPRTSKQNSGENSTKKVIDIAEFRERLKNTDPSKGCSNVVGGLERHLKSIIGDDEEMCMQYDFEPSSQPNTKSNTLVNNTELENPEKNNVKATKKNNAKSKHAASSSHTNALPITAFLRSLHPSKAGSLIIYHGNYSSIHELRQLKTSDQKPVSLIPAENFAMYCSEITLCVWDPVLPPSLALLYCLLKKIPVVQQKFVERCLKAKEILKPGQGGETTGDMTSEVLMNSMDLAVFEKTNFKILSDKQDIRKATSALRWLAETSISKFGGRIVSEMIDLDIVVVIDEQSGWLDKKEINNYKDKLVKVVNMGWVVDSIFEGRKKDTSDKKYICSQTEITGTTKKKR